MKEIIIQVDRQIDNEAISLEKWLVKKQRRRKRVANRMARKYPLFAVEFMQDEFQGYTWQKFEDDLKGKTLPKKRKGKSPLKRQGRYPLMKEALTDYRITGNQEFLYKAQQYRKNMFKPFELEYYIKKERRRMSFPSTTPAKLIIELSKVKFTTWEQLDAIIKEKTRYIHVL